MSKYTEAIEKPLFGIMQNGKIYFEIDDEWLDTIESALEIADRLEQADARQILRKVTCDICCEAETCGQGELGDWCGEYDVLLKTVKIALADIRGEENGE